MGIVEQPSTQGVPAQPTPNTSGQVQGTSANTEEKLLTVSESQLEALIERKLQGQKDKRVAGVLGQLSDFESRLARLKELTQTGWTEAQAKEVMRLQEAVERGNPVQTEAQRPGSPTAPPANLDPSVIQAFGLDVNSPEVTNILRTEANPLTALAAVALAKRQAAQPNPAQQATANTGASVQQETYETLTEELAGLNRNPGPNIKRIQEINRKLAGLRGR